MKKFLLLAPLLILVSLIVQNSHAMDEKQNLEQRLLQPQPNADVTIEIKPEVKARKDNKNDLEVRLLPAQPHEHTKTDIEYEIDDLEKGIPDKIKNALPNVFAEPLVTTIHQYARLTEKEKTEVIVETEMRLTLPQRAKKAFNNIISKYENDDHSIHEYVCFGGCVFWGAVTYIILKLT